MHPLLNKQLDEAREANGPPDVRKLLLAVSAAYSEWDDERRGVVRSMKLLADETTAAAREVRENAAAQLQAIVDHVKDAILTVDEIGRIETVNTTGERVFGYDEAEVRDRRLDLLIPSLARHPRLTGALDELAESVEDTQFDLAPRETRGRHRNGTLFDAEIGVSKVRLDRRSVYIVCLRDTTDRKLAEAAIRESEARYRTLVENAPEAIVVLDTDAGHFVECNDNAVRFFKMSREELLAAGPERISPPEQPDGTPSFGISRGYIDRALAGEAPCFEWLHRDAHGHDIPCEVRMVRLPSSGRRLIRGSITDITERKRSEVLAIGERRVFERMTGNVDLAATLEAITETAERVTPDALCTVSTYDESAGVLRHIAGQRLPREFLNAIAEVAIAARNGSCGAAIYLQRQVVVAEIARDALWENLRKPALAAGLRACWSTPIRVSDGRMVGTVALYFRQPRSPLKRDFELMARLTALAGIAIERMRAEEALRRSEARYRGLFENVIEGVYRATGDARLESVNPALVQMLGYERAEDLLALPSTRDLYVQRRRPRGSDRGSDAQRRGAQRRVPASPARRRHHHGGRERAAGPRRAGTGHRPRGHDRGHLGAQAGRGPAVRGEGKGPGHARVDRRRGHHRRRGGTRRVSESGRRAADRLGVDRGRGPAGQRGHPPGRRVEPAAVREPDRPLPARGTHGGDGRAVAADQPRAASRSRSRTPRRRSATAAAGWSAW